MDETVDVEMGECWGSRLRFVWLERRDAGDNWTATTIRVQRRVKDNGGEPMWAHLAELTPADIHELRWSLDYLEHVIH